MAISFTFFLNAAINFILGLAVAAVLGPAEFGRFSIAWVISLTLSTVFFDWARLSATRFYGEVARAKHPDLRASLHAAYIDCTLLLVAGALIVVVFRIHVGLSVPLLVVTVATSIVVSRFDLWMALARARFLNTVYIRLVVVKNIAALVLMVGAGMIFHSAAWVLGAMILGVVISYFPVRRSLRDADARFSLARKKRIVEFARYGFPLVTATAIYQIILLANRWLATSQLGYAEAGQLSLATDLSIRLLLAVGAGFDVFLFQLVVGREAMHGHQAAQRQIASNMLLVATVLIPLAAGYALTMPSFEAVFIPAQYRGAYSGISLVLIPGVLAYCFIQFALGPVFQLARQTTVLAWSACAALVCDLSLLMFLPSDLGLAKFAIAHSTSFIVGFMIAAAIALQARECWPRVREFVTILAATAAMSLAVWPTRDIAPAWLSFISAVIVGASVYFVFVLWFDIAGLREPIISRFRTAQRAILCKLM
jgi:O-antigen/teichoic acid export membrane protein